MKITQAIIEYIALSDQPLSEVGNVGFLRLLHVLEPRYDVPSRHYMTDTELPKLHDSVKKHIHSLLQASSAFSFTTDIWTSSVSPVSLISLTSQWIDEFHAATSHITCQTIPRLAHQPGYSACVSGNAPDMGYT